ncbi:hypothetical protein K488DRAFT_77395 [Vararia minispora EC-137]|uniref:Uncharacterized protein n=1 Tax=Vararia minispora EC-137 TaxID=1314806 RepID=A0ACB8QQW3_9AGAM|nr:hypothetical protein K488DRAFT_77395 [Vararia minispora EC-137]
MASSSPQWDSRHRAFIPPSQLQQLRRDASPPSHAFQAGSPTPPSTLAMTPSSPSPSPALAPAPPPAHGHSRSSSFFSLFKSGPGDPATQPARPASVVAEDPSRPSPPQGRRPSLEDRRRAPPPATPTSPSGQQAQGQLHPEIRSVVQLTLAHAHKIYCSGPLVRRIEQLPDGNAPARDDGWRDVWAQLGGTTLSVWDMHEIEEANRAGKEVPPTYINITDAFVRVLGAVNMPATPARPAQRYTNIVTVNSAGSNLLLFSCPDAPSLVAWASALRLAAWEKARLEEIYSAHLIRITLNDGRDAHSPLVRGRSEGWVRVRLAGQTDWKRLWMVVSAATSPHDPSADTASTTTDAAGGSGSGPQRKRRISALFGAAPADAPAGDRAGIAFFAAQKGKERKRPVLTLADVSQAFAVYPERPELINRSTLMKVEGTIGDEDVAGTMRGREGWALIMPELEPGFSQAREMLKWLISIHDAFGLYGRPREYAWDPRNPASLMFAYPIGPRREMLFLEREAAESMDPREDRTSQVRAQLHRILAQRMREQGALPPAPAHAPSNGPSKLANRLPPIAAGESPVEEERAPGGLPQLPPLSFSDDGGADALPARHPGRLSAITERTERDGPAASLRNGSILEGSILGSPVDAVSALPPRRSSEDTFARSVTPGAPSRAGSAKPTPSIAPSASFSGSLAEPAAPSSDVHGALQREITGLLGGPPESSVGWSQTSVNAPASTAPSPPPAPSAARSPLFDSSAPLPPQTASPEQISARAHDAPTSSPTPQDASPVSQGISPSFTRRAMSPRTQSMSPEPAPAPSPLPAAERPSSVQRTASPAGSFGSNMFSAMAASPLTPGTPSAGSNRLSTPAASQNDGARMGALKAPSPTAQASSASNQAPMLPSRSDDGHATMLRDAAGVLYYMQQFEQGGSPPRHQPPPRMRGAPPVSEDEEDEDGEEEESSETPPRPPPQLALRASGVRASAVGVGLDRRPTGARAAPSSNAGNRSLVDRQHDAPTSSSPPSSRLAPRPYQLHENMADEAADALAALSYLEQDEPPTTTYASSPPPRTALASAHQQPTIVEPPEERAGTPSSESQYRSSFAPSKKAMARKAKTEAQQAAHSAAVTRPGRTNGRPQRARKAGAWGDSSDEEEEDEEDEDEEVDSDGEPTGTSAPPSGPQSASGHAPPGRALYGNAPREPSPLAGAHERPPRTLPQARVRVRAAGSYEGEEQPYAPQPRRAVPDQYARSAYDDAHGAPALTTHAPVPTVPKTIWNQVLDPNRPPGALPESNSNTRDTFVQLEAPEATMTKAFTPHGLLSVGLQDKQDRSAKKQEELARETGAALVNVPNKPPPPQTGLLGAITGYERERKREGGVGAALTEREREKRLAEERQRKLDDFQRQQLEQMAQGGSMYGAQAGSPFGAYPAAAAMMNPMMMGMNPMMTGYMGFPGMMPFGNPQHMFAAQQAQQAYQHAMMNFSQAGSQVGGDGAGAGGVNPMMTGGSFDPRMSMMPMLNPMMTGGMGMSPMGMMGMNPMGMQMAGAYDPRFAQMAPPMDGGMGVQQSPAGGALSGDFGGTLSFC